MFPLLVLLALVVCATARVQLTHSFIGNKVNIGLTKKDQLAKNVLQESEIIISANPKSYSRGEEVVFETPDGQRLVGKIERVHSYGKDKVMTSGTTSKGQPFTLSSFKGAIKAQVDIANGRRLEITLKGKKGSARYATRIVDTNSNLDAVRARSKKHQDVNKIENVVFQKKADQLKNLKNSKSNLRKNKGTESIDSAIIVDVLITLPPYEHAYVDLSVYTASEWLEEFAMYQEYAANRAFENSGIDARVRVQSFMLTEPDSSMMDAAMTFSNIYTDGDGYFDTIETVRSTYKADVVLIVDSYISEAVISSLHMPTDPLSSTIAYGLIPFYDYSNFGTASAVAKLTGWYLESGSCWDAEDTTYYPYCYRTILTADTCVTPSANSYCVIAPYFTGTNIIPTGAFSNFNAPIPSVIRGDDVIQFIDGTIDQLSQFKMSSYEGGLMLNVTPPVFPSTSSCIERELLLTGYGLVDVDSGIPTVSFYPAYDHSAAGPFMAIVVDYSRDFVLVDITGLEIFDTPLDIVVTNPNLASSSGLGGISTTGDKLFTYSSSIGYNLEYHFNTSEAKNYHWFSPLENEWMSDNTKSGNDMWGWYLTNEYQDPSLTGVLDTSYLRYNGMSNEVYLVFNVSEKGDATPSCDGVVNKFSFYYDRTVHLMECAGLVDVVNIEIFDEVDHKWTWVANFNLETVDVTMNQPNVWKYGTVDLSTRMVKPVAVRLVYNDTYPSMEESSLCLGSASFRLDEIKVETVYDCDCSVNFNVPVSSPYSSPTMPSQMYPWNVPQNWPQSAPQYSPQNWPQNAPQNWPQSAPQSWPQNWPQSYSPQNWPQNAPQNWPQNAPQNWPQNWPQSYTPQYSPQNWPQNAPQNWPQSWSSPTSEFPPSNWAWELGLSHAPSGHCAPGHFELAPNADGIVNTDQASQYCTMCPVGKYQDEWGAVQCKACPAGTYGMAHGMIACHSCFNNTYSFEGASWCRSCSSGKYSQMRASKCSPCPIGSTSASGMNCFACNMLR